MARRPAMALLAALSAACFAQPDERKPEGSAAAAASASASAADGRGAAPDNGGSGKEPPQGADGRGAAPDNGGSGKEPPQGADGRGAAPSEGGSGKEDAQRPQGGGRLVALGVPLTKLHRERRFVWRQLDTVNWQPVGEALPALGPEAARDSGGCPAGMLAVEGEFLVDTRGREDSDDVMFAQHEACTLWRTEDRGVNGLCDRFDRDRWMRVSARFPRKRLRFCIDRYEYPNSYGEFPLVVATFSEGERYCAREGKRLCNESEWTFACEGEEGMPYPYGYERDTSVCTIDILGPGPEEDTFKPRTTGLTARGSDQSWRGKRSGESPRCKSSFGVEDLTGNVDEWTRTVRAYGYKMIMKGGHWGPGRHRCRPQTRGHGPYYVRYDQGFRCCKDAPER